MAGMNLTSSAGVSSYGSRPISIMVTGVCQQDVTKTSNYEIKVPFSQMSQAMRSINRMGGKISTVSVAGFQSKGIQEEE
ncbi:MAG: rod-capping linker protein [Leptolyngbya sp. SIOISBB]|nr:rod-capping linker protein [Leptolyngbya sp. SIOISBB]